MSHASSVQLDFPDNDLELLPVHDENIFAWHHVAQGCRSFQDNTIIKALLTTFSMQIYAEIKFAEIKGNLF